MSAEKQNQMVRKLSECYRTQDTRQQRRILTRGWELIGRRNGTSPVLLSSISQTRPQSFSLRTIKPAPSVAKILFPFHGPPRGDDCLSGLVTFIILEAKDPTSQRETCFGSSLAIIILMGETVNSAESTVFTYHTFSDYSVPSPSIDILGAGSSSKTREMLSQIDTATAMQDIDRAVRARSRSESERAESCPKDI